MAIINSESGAIVASCPSCGSDQSTFEWRVNESPIGAVRKTVQKDGSHKIWEEYRLFRCAGCGSGGYAELVLSGYDQNYPGETVSLTSFYPLSAGSLPLPESVPEGIRKEFREAELCLANGCYRAAAGLFRSVLEKTMRDNGYKRSRESLYVMVDAMAADGAITESRRKKAHEDVRALGNDVLHDDWQEISEDAVQSARKYSQRIVEDLYDDRISVVALLTDKGRLPISE